ncbi:hypothetical protein [Cohnella kolymensis]|uniref:hypothetical protein n=1 Tax=Cohnella kolymensis TaxID=1590652 RepID=UPI00190F3158|nr:hypothetical protein [Cohnella kolymensis]
MLRLQERTITTAAIFFKIGLVMQLVKDRGNPHDDEAIRAEIPPIGKVGYVANSSFSVPRGCRSAGRLYDTFDDTALAIVRFVVKDTVIVEVVKSVEILQIVHTNNENALGNDYLPDTAHAPQIRESTKDLNSLLRRKEQTMEMSNLTSISIS